MFSYPASLLYISERRVRTDCILKIYITINLFQGQQIILKRPEADFRTVF